MQAPSVEEFQTAHAALRNQVIRTPTLTLAHALFRERFPADVQVRAKLELFQHAGSFKARGAILGIRQLTPEQRSAGVVAASGGNHAIAVSWAARAVGVNASIFMPETADRLRIDACRKLGAKVTLVSDIAKAFDMMLETEQSEGRTIMHPFEARHMTLGAGSCGIELLEDAADSDIFVIPVGGGGLISGMSAVIRQARPGAKIFGVEPVGADTMFRSLEEGKPVTIANVDTIADSLGSPYALPYSFEISRQNVSAIARVTDDEIRSAMRLYFDALRLIAEPACAAALAAVCGPLKEICAGQKVAIIACGSNISLERYDRILGQ
ncbi:serine/threonine dehydratase [Sulfitobacter porphyrae]|nr:serine/threonine dehydratase [Sulfitobacter porphyrae]